MPIGIYKVGKQAMCRLVLCPMKYLDMAFVGVEQNGQGVFAGEQCVAEQQHTLSQG